jgi:uncharacterized tellurite resistance protein B-like protein
MSIFKKLFGGGDDEPVAGGSTAADTETVRRIMRRLEELPAERARYVGAFAYVLSRVAHADLEFSAPETAAMEKVMREHAKLPEDQAVLVVEIAKAQSRLYGATEDFLVTREFAAIADPDERRHLLEALFAVAAADGTISTPEETRIRQVASELGFTHREYVDARAQWSEYRAVLRPPLG